MDPLIGGALIGGAVNLLGGLLGSYAQGEQAKRQAEMDAYLTLNKLQQAGIQQRTSGEQSALSNLIESYRSALLG